MKKAGKVQMKRYRIFIEKTIKWNILFENGRIPKIVENIIPAIVGIPLVDYIIDAVLTSDENRIMAKTIIYIGVGFSVFALNTIKKWRVIIPYKPTNNFSGLYSAENIDKMQLSTRNGLIPRDDEVEFLMETILTVGKNNDNSIKKQGICIVGKSGSGKSTILHLLKKNGDKEINIVDYTQKMDSIVSNLIMDFGSNYIEKLHKSDSRILFIFDQFERFFYKSMSKQNDIEQVISLLSSLNIVILFSIREEFLGEFIARFDLNNISKINHSSSNKKSQSHGIVLNKELVSVITPIDNPGSHFIFCLDEFSEKHLNLDSIEYKETTMEGHCENAFGIGGLEIYLNFRKNLLIEQQIIFNMFDNEKAETGYLRLLSNPSEYLITLYLDTQLCSTGDFFTASRVMYLLSLANQYHISFQFDDILNALCVPDNKAKKDRIIDVLSKLMELQLIKNVKYNSNEMIEISHDYIANVYIDYAKTDFSPGVRSAIDEYVAEFVRNTSISERIRSFREKSSSNFFGRSIFFCSILFSICGFIYNLFNKECGYIISVEILTLMSIVYVYVYYSRIIRFSQNLLLRICVSFLFVASMISGSLTMILFDSWLCCLGIGNSILGLACLVIGCSKGLSSIGKSMFSQYGFKTILMGVLLVVMDSILSSVETEVSISVLKIIAMLSLLVYAYYAHMNEEFVYVHVEGLLSE